MNETGFAWTCAGVSGPPGEGSGERGFTEERATFTSCSGLSLLWLGSAEGKRVLLGDEGRNRGEPDGLDGRPEPPLWPPDGVNEVNAKLSLPPGPSLLPDAFEFREALLPCRLCRLGGSSISGCGTRTIVRRLVREREGFMFTSLCSPQGSAAAIDPLRADSLRVRAWGPRTGLRSGVDTALILD